MDLRAVYEVMRRRRRLVVMGLGVAFVLATLAYARPVFDGGVPTLKPRVSESWRSETILFITQNGFPWGRAVPTYRPGAQAGTPPVQVGDQDRLASLAALYSELASSDAVKKIALRKGPLRADIAATPVTYASTQFAYPQVLPLIKVSATTDSAPGARAAVTRIGLAFRSFIQRQQGQANISQRDRVVVNVSKRPDKPVLIAGPSLVMPVIVFLAMATLVIGLALVLDNMGRPGRMVPERVASVVEAEPRVEAQPEPAEPAQAEVAWHSRRHKPAGQAGQTDTSSGVQAERPLRRLNS